MPFTYQSGQEIKKGDQIFYHDEPGVIEFVADPLVPDAQTDWYIKEYGGGVMIAEPKVFGHVFVSDTADDEDLVFVARRD